MPKVSVIMPVYNETENVLKYAINSILKQTFTDFELIIINDGSVMDIDSVINSYDDTRIRYHKNEKNLGIIKTLNIGLDLAQAEYIARMDADDISTRTRFEEEVLILDENPQVGVVASGAVKFPSKMRIQAPQSSEDLKYLSMCYANCVVHPSVMMRKSVLDNHNIKYSDEFWHAEDYCLWMELFKHTEFYTIQKPLVLLRERKDSVSSQNSLLQAQNAEIIRIKSMLHELNITDTLVEENLINFARTKTISRQDFLIYEKILHQILEIVFEKADVVWQKYIASSLMEYRKKIHNAIVWDE